MGAWGLLLLQPFSPLFLDLLLLLLFSVTCDTVIQKKSLTHVFALPCGKAQLPLSHDTLNLCSGDALMI